VSNQPIKELSELEPDLALQSCIFLLFVDLIIREFLETERFKGIIAEGKRRQEKSDALLADDEMGISTPLTFE
jgi:hypothetical protein